MVFWSVFFFFLRHGGTMAAPWRHHGMARIVIRVSRQRQKHGASQLGEIAKWLLQFSGDHHPPSDTPDTSIPTLRTPPLLRQDPLPQPSPPPSSLPLQSSSLPLSAPSCRRPSSPPLSSCCCRRRRRVFRCRFNLIVVCYLCPPPLLSLPPLLLPPTPPPP